MNDFGSAITQRHDNDHGLHFVLRNQRIHDEIRFADGSPAAGIVAVAVQKIKNRIAGVGVGIVAGRSVNVKIAIVAHDV